MQQLAEDEQVRPAGNTCVGAAAADVTGVAAAPNAVPVLARKLSSLFYWLAD
jgi:hypothetical protein